MKASTLLLAVALGTATAAAFAQSDATPATSDNHSWWQAGTYEQQAEARDRQLEQQGDYSQYAD